MDGPLRNFKRKSPRRNADKSIDIQIKEHNSLFGKRKSKGKNDASSMPKPVKPMVF